MNETITGKELIIITDLDGTILDHDNYTYMKALPAIDLLHRKGVPLIFCSAKTRAEQLIYRHKLACKHPFIVENGAAIFIDQDYFSFDFTFNRMVDGFKVIELGMAYDDIRKILDRIRSTTGLHIEGFGDCSPKRVAELTGMDIESAKLAMQREYEETIVSKFSNEELEMFQEALFKYGLKLKRGSRFYAVSGPYDKGQAAVIVADLYRHKNKNVHVVGIGDSFNDEPLLGIADTPVIVQKPGATWENVNVPRLKKVKGVGPEGWNNFIMSSLAG